MSLHRDDVVYVDPTMPFDVLSAKPMGKDGQIYPTISVSVDVEFGDDQYAQRCRTLVVCINPGDEMLVLALLGDRLRGQSDDTSPTVVASLDKLIQKGQEIGVPERHIRALVDLVKTAPSPAATLS
jgi:hypothetical protein